MSNESFHWILFSQLECEIYDFVSDPVKAKANKKTNMDFICLVISFFPKERLP